MNNYFTSFRLLSHLEASKIWAMGMLNKNSLPEYTIVWEKEPQKKGMWPLWKVHIKQKKQCKFDSGWFERQQSSVRLSGPERC